jgi:Putative prokaryotic signal transducing protein
MRLVHTSFNTAMAHHLKNVLEGVGIECTVKNEFLRMAAGDIPLSECMTELWVVNDDQFDEARQYLETGPLPENASPEPWLCPKCGEKIEPQFTACWRCGGTALSLAGARSP